MATTSQGKFSSTLQHRTTRISIRRTIFRHNQLSFSPLNRRRTTLRHTNNSTTIRRRPLLNHIKLTTTSRRLTVLSHSHRILLKGTNSNRTSTRPIKNTIFSIMKQVTLNPLNNTFNRTFRLIRPRRVQVYTRHHLNRHRYPYPSDSYISNPSYNGQAPRVYNTLHNTTESTEFYSLSKTQPYVLSLHHTPTPYPTPHPPHTPTQAST